VNMLEVVSLQCMRAREAHAACCHSMRTCSLGMCTQEGSADTLQLERGTPEEQQADFIAEKLGCAHIRLGRQPRAWPSLAWPPWPAAACMDPSCMAGHGWTSCEVLQSLQVNMVWSAMCCEQAAQGGLDLCAEHQGARLHRVDRGGLPDRRHARLLLSRCCAGPATAVFCMLRRPCNRCF
jgi:hypothetical protein